MNIVDSIKLSDIEQIAKANKYRLVKLADSQGRQVVYQNQPTAAAFKAKLQEIKERAQVLPNDCVYYVIFKNALAGEEWAYRFVKGNPVTILQQQQSTLSQPAAPIMDYNALSTKDSEIAALKNQIEQLKLQFMYEAKLNELNAKLDTMSEKKEEKNQLLGFAETVLPNFLPILDRYMSIKEVEARAKLAAAGGKATEPVKPKLAPIGSEAYNNMLEKLLQLDEESFNAKLAQLAAIDQNYAAQVYNDCTEETEEEEQQQPDETE
jgi:hypothetical protein